LSALCGAGHILILTSREGAGVWLRAVNGAVVGCVTLSMKVCIQEQILAKIFESWLWFGQIAMAIGRLKVACVGYAGKYLKFARLIHVASAVFLGATIQQVFITEGVLRLNCLSSYGVAAHQTVIWITCAWAAGTVCAQ
jgi:hypothetical protein